MIKKLDVGLANIVFIETKKKETKKLGREFIVYDKKIFPGVESLIKWLKNNVGKIIKERLLNGRVKIYLQKSDFISQINRKNGIELCDTVVIEIIYV